MKEKNKGLKPSTSSIYKDIKSKSRKLLSDFSYKKYDKYYVLDTNIILNDSSSIIKLSSKSDNLIILPETVLDEIDSKKSGLDEINYEARQFARMLRDATVINNFSYKGLKIVCMKINNGLDIDLHIISKEKYKTKLKNVALNIFNDRMILEITKDAEKYYKEKLEFISLDVMAVARAVSLNLKTSSLLGSNKGEEIQYNFHKEIKLLKEYTIQELNNMNIKTLDENHQNDIFYHSLILPSGAILYSILKNNKINIVNIKNMRKQSVVPQNLEQKILTKALFDNHFQIVLSDSLAGSGKTLLTLSVSIQMIFDKQNFNYDKIIYIRNSIESLDKGEEVGFLSGNGGKFKIFNHPLMDSLNFIAISQLEKQNLKINKETIDLKIKSLITENNIETMWVGEMRGRTLSKAIVIIDEAQNMSNKTMQMVLSRIDSSCKVVILGSNKQIDNIYINKHTNAFSTIFNEIKKKEQTLNIFACKLNKVLRGPITEWAESIFNNQA